MLSKFFALALLALCVLVGHSEAQEGCVARPVSGLSVSSSYLTWTVSSEETCEITEFLVHIWQDHNPQEYIFSVTETQVNVSFLAPCLDWTFVVTPVSEHTRGRNQRIVSAMPLPTGADLSIDYVNVTHNEAMTETILHWEMHNPDYTDCKLTYRVTVEENGSPVIEDFYVTNNTIDLFFLAPCSSYQFSVRAINIGRPTIEGPQKLKFHFMPGRVQTAPTLQFVNASAHEAYLSFRLDSSVRNPCQVLEFYVDGGNFFEKHVHIADEIRRQPVNVSIQALNANSMYFLRASVRNIEGWSIPTVAAIQTLRDDD